MHARAGNGRRGPRGHVGEKKRDGRERARLQFVKKGRKERGEIEVTSKRNIKKGVQHEDFPSGHPT